MKTLKLSDELALPLDAATRRLAILAMSGAGKSNTAVVLAEAMFDAGLPWVAIDPKGDWWGVRSSQNGKGPGLPIPILGGLHGDVPLEPTAGKVIGELIVDQRLTCVVDVSEFVDRQQMWGFLSDLGDTLLHRNRQALHVFLEEADEYLPQRTGEKGNLPRCLGIWQRLVKRGRFRGIGTTQITQRSASLNKDTLYQAEALIAMRCTGQGDRKAIAGWVEHHNAGEELVASLPTLADGEGWFSSPAWLRQTVRVQFNRRRTLDSGSTPVQVEGKSSKPATLADVNLSDLQVKMQATIERAKADDPKELKKQIAELQRELKSKTALKSSAPAEKVSEKIREVPILTDADRTLLTRVDTAVHEIEIKIGGPVVSADLAQFLKSAIDSVIQEHEEQRRAFKAEIEAALSGKRLQRIREKVATARNGLDELRRLGEQNARQIHDLMPALASVGAPTIIVRGELAEDRRLVSPKGTLKPHVRKLLTALAQYKKTFDRASLLRLTGYTPSGDMSTAFAGLADRGLVVAGADGFSITAAGLQALGPFEPLPEGQDLRTYLLQRESTHGRKLLAVWFDAYPDSIARKDAIDRAGYKPSGDISTAIGKFVSVGWLVETSDGLRASDDFFQ